MEVKKAIQDKEAGEIITADHLVNSTEDRVDKGILMARDMGEIISTLNSKIVKVETMEIIEETNDSDVI